ncbi:MAG: hypothetical protein IAF38_10885 [Bacteroidia bacterium]|nr:hypothetical protein [Bacteroidia bacterium]
MAPSITDLETATCRFSKPEPGIILVHFKSKSVITVEEQAVNFAAHLKFSGGKAHCILYTADEFVNFTPEARQRSKELEPEINFLAAAGLTKNLAYKIVADFYVRFNKPQKPFKNFSDEKKALEWLRTFLK